MPQNKTALQDPAFIRATEIAKKLREKIRQKIAESAITKAERYTPSSENERALRQRSQ